MRKVLLLSPHFVPSDLPDMQRLRTCLGCFSAYSWQAHLLCVASDHIRREVDQNLWRTIPDDVAITATGALPRLPGLSAIGLRAYFALHRAGRRLLQHQSFDLIFVSTTAFPVMHLARRWSQEFNIPYVLDFQDPWGIYPKEAQRFLRPNWKARLMQRFHRKLEAPTVTDAAGLVVVSHRYSETLQDHYGLTVPALVQPLPFARRDFEVAGQLETDETMVSASDIRCLYLGRVPDTMRIQIGLLFSLLRQVHNRAGGQKLSLRFVGTAYDQSDKTVISDMAERYSVSDCVEELPERISYLQSLSRMQNCDLLVLLGSSDTSYLPSKVTPYLASGKPVLLIANGASQLFRQLAPRAGVLAIDASAPPDERFDLLQKLTVLLQTSDYGARGALEANEATAQLGQLFDWVCDKHG